MGPRASYFLFLSIFSFLKEARAESLSLRFLLALSTNEIYKLKRLDDPKEKSLRFKDNYWHQVSQDYVNEALGRKEPTLLERQLL